MNSQAAVNDEIRDLIAQQIIDPTLSFGKALGRLEGLREGWESGHREGQQEIIAAALQAILSTRSGAAFPPWFLAKINHATPEILRRWLQPDQPQLPLAAILHEFAERLSLPPAHSPASGMAQQYDTTFKSLFRRSHGVLSRLLFGEVVEWPNVELPEVRNLRVDLLARCAGGIYRQLELQVNNDSQMPFRMLEYAVALQRALGEPVEQTVLYVGRGPLTMPASYQGPRTRHDYTILNLREMDGTPLLESDDWTDNEWALLTRTDPERVMQVVFEKLRRLSGSEQTEAVNSFVLIGGILGIEKEIQRRISQEMSIDVMQNQVLGPAIRQGIEQGRLEGRQEGRQEGIAYALQAVLKARFGPLPDWALAKIANATPEAQDRWLQADSSGLTLDDFLR
jgi:predicted transposase YdaD